MILWKALMSNLTSIKGITLSFEEL